MTSSAFDGLAASSRYGWLDFTTSEWWTLPPGLSTIAYTADVSSSPSQMVLTWHHVSII